MGVIALATTCKGRIDHVRRTLPANLRDNRLSSTRFILLNYNSPDGLLSYIVTCHKEDLKSGRLVVYSHPADGAFHVAHAKNLAMRCAMLEGAEILVTVDADNFTGPNFDRYVAERFREPGIFLCPNHQAIKQTPFGQNRPHRGYAGRLAVRTQDFVKAGGYNEAYNTWRGEDIDFNHRAVRLGLKMSYIDNQYLETIPHSAEVRFREWPHAQKYESPDAWKTPTWETDTVVNNGNWGCGVVYRNFDPEPIELKPLPTRVFGIGLHKTATTSLHRAFQILGYDSLHWGQGEVPRIWEEMNSTGRSRTLEKFYAACDLPIPLLYRQLDAAYPGSKFILTVRDEQKWLRSIERLWDAQYNRSRWQWDVWPISNTLHQALYGRRDFNAETMLNRYRQHNAQAKEYFLYRPNDLLVMDMDAGAGWPELCGFLGEKIPVSSYPREYVTQLQEGS